MLGEASSSNCLKIELLRLSTAPSCLRMSATPPDILRESLRPDRLLDCGESLSMGPTSDARRSVLAFDARICISVALALSYTRAYASGKRTATASNAVFDSVYMITSDFARALAVRR